MEKTWLFMAYLNQDIQYMIKIFFKEKHKSLILNSPVSVIK